MIAAQALSAPSTNVSPAAKNPFPAFSEEAEQLKFPPSAGTVDYWGNGRFNVTLNNLYDEEKSGNTCILEEMICFRSEPGRVYGRNKDGFAVVDLATATYAVYPRIEDFPAEDQPILTKLMSKTKGNTYFNPKNLHPIRI